MRSSWQAKQFVNLSYVCFDLCDLLCVSCVRVSSHVLPHICVLSCVRVLSHDALTHMLSQEFSHVIALIVCSRVMISYVRSHMCAHSYPSPFMFAHRCVLSYLCSRTFALTCVLSRKCSHMRVLTGLCCFLRSPGLCALMCALAYLLSHARSFSCVCVCVSPSVSRSLNPFGLQQGRQARYTYLTQRSYGVSREVRADHSHVPADQRMTPMVHPVAVFLIPWFFAR